MSDFATYQAVAKRELQEIPGINAEKVDRYGGRILTLVKNSKRRLDELTAGQTVREDTVPDPNHETVVYISSDEDADFVQRSSDTECSASLLSRFFDPDDEVLAFRQTGE